MFYLTQFLWSALLALSAVAAEPEVTVYHEKLPDGYQIYASNPNYCPVTLDLDLQLTNLSSSTGNQDIFILPPRSEGVHLMDLRVVKPGAYSMNYEYRSKWGDYSREDKYDAKFVYYLPFAAGAEHELSQGYNGSQSHQGKNALDFDMPEGTIITAARAGTVIELVEKHEAGCPEERCEAFDNYVIIYHEDNTLAKYSHLRQNGVLVELGDEVAAGQPIGESGTTGWAQGPHLHFSVFLAGYDDPKTLKTRFRLRANRPKRKGGKLKEGRFYARNYE
jgi:murein DD-endopeptidase MepM/ murein hydrolase activator NlpD